MPVDSGSGRVAMPAGTLGADATAADLIGAGSLALAGPPTEPSERLVLSLLAQMPAETRAGFADSQVRALREAARRSQWGRHAIDIRLSLPLPGRRCYLVLIGGHERRSTARRSGERRAHPLLRIRNMPSLAVVVGALIGLGWLAGTLVRGLAG
ncbi:MAG: hypothetical protein U1E14_04765 [Geminicoccaceae bacterium]